MKPDDTRYKVRLKHLHHEAVQQVLDKHGNHHLLNEPAPEIDKEERKLPRKTRTTLSQLRSGYSPYLNSFRNRIGAVNSDSCPNCNSSIHTTPHLFECPAKPTTLTIKSLWEDTHAAANFLGLVTEEEDDDDDET